MAVALTIGGSNQPETYSGGLSGGGSLTKNGSGNQTMSGVNTYTGITTVNAGTITVPTGGSIGLSGATVVGGAVNEGAGATVTVSGGSLGGSSLAVGGHNSAGNFNFSSGTVDITGNITTSDNDTTSIQITGGTLTAGGLNEGRQGTGPTPNGTTGIPGSAVTTAIQVNGSSAVVNLRFERPYDRQQIQFLRRLFCCGRRRSDDQRSDRSSVLKPAPRAERWNYLEVTGGSYTMSTRRHPDRPGGKRHWGQ